MTEITEEMWKVAKKYKFLQYIETSEFYQNLAKTYVVCKKSTGKDPQEWLHHFNRSHKDDRNGVIGWIDALSAIEAIVKKYENMDN